MLPLGVTIPATVPQGSEIPEGLMNNPVLPFIMTHLVTFCYFIVKLSCSTYLPVLNVQKFQGNLKMYLENNNMYIH
jgi:hypothetical protein